MMNKKLVISLFAGALLLPASAALAGVVNGTCVNCHTMHNSQDGGTMTATISDQLLSGTGCNGCHAQGVGNDGASGLAVSGVAAPQVDEIGTNRLNGGYFTRGAAITDSQQHNVSDIGNTWDANMTGLGADGAQPGGTAADVSAGTGGTARVGIGDGVNGPALTCQGCHSQAGHHNPVATAYRMLTGANTTTATTNYGVVTGRSASGYDATAMNDFCANCHGLFHEGTTLNSQLSTTGAGIWIRHPTDVRVLNNATDAPSIVNLTSAGDNDAVVVGRDGTTADIIMCISCHLPHGSGFPDLLSYDYTLAIAGDAAATVPGCETCHSYSATGM